MQDRKAGPGTHAGSSRSGGEHLPDTAISPDMAAGPAGHAGRGRHRDIRALRPIGRRPFDTLPAQAPAVFIEAPRQGGSPAAYPQGASMSLGRRSGGPFLCRFDHGFAGKAVGPPRRPAFPVAQERTRAGPSGGRVTVLSRSPARAWRFARAPVQPLGRGAWQEVPLGHEAATEASFTRRRSPILKKHVSRQHHGACRMRRRPRAVLRPGPHWDLV